MDLTLRPTTEDDLDFVLATETDPDVSRWVTAQSREHHLEVIGSPNEEHLVFTDADGRPVGYVILTGLRDINSSIEVRRIAVTERGRGIGREALRLVVDRCFDEHGAHRVWLDVKPGNERARRVYSGLGFVYEGTLRDAIRDGDGWDALELMSVLEDEWT
jgi:diamine N-acetyltransferase